MTAEPVGTGAAGSRRPATLALTLALLLSVTPGVAVAAKATTSPAPVAPDLMSGLDGAGERRFSIDWKVDVTVSTEWSGRDLVLRFSRPLGAAPFGELGPQLAGDVESLRYGYDSLLLQLAPGIEPRVESTGSGVAVTLTRVGGGAAVAENGQAQLGFVRAKALLRSGSASAARAELQRYIADVPVPPEIARASQIARIEGSSGNKWRSFAAFDRLLKDNPRNPVLLAHYATVLIDTGKLKLAGNVLDYR